MDSASGFDLREVLLGPWWIKVRVSGLVVVVALNIESLVVLIESLVLRILHSRWRHESTTWLLLLSLLSSLGSHEARCLGLPPVILASQEVSFLNLPFEFVCEGLLLLLFLVDLCLVW